MIDTGKYNKDQEEYRRIIEQMYADYPPITLPPEYAQFFHNDLLRLLIRLARYKFVARLVRKTDRVLEVGAGSGVGAMFISQHCAHVTALELKTTEVEEGRSMNRRPNVEFVLGDLYDYRPAAPFDVVLALDVIEHFSEEDGRRLVAEMVRHLAPTGMLVIGTPSLHSWPHQSAASKASHIKCYDQAELQALVDGFCGRTLAFGMNDEMVHTGHPKLTWYYFILGLLPASGARQA
jgi:2-polyprenyl-3-methyl-5-hydroxy-6-metoxy-1,4-benzoquinol methylase